MSSAVVSMRDIVTRFGDKLIHDHVDLTVNEGDIYGLLGGSGSGKSTLLREMIMLLRPESGQITVLDYDVLKMSHQSMHELRQNWGVLFQSGALFSSLTVAENIAITLKEYTKLPSDLIDEIVIAKIKMVGLPEHAADLFPAELSGGMIKRASLARALAMDPRILFLDEPTSGLDPVGAEAFDNLIVSLRDLLGVSVVMVTHDLDSIWTIVDRLCVLGDKRVVAEGTLDEVMTVEHPVINNFFKGKRGTLRHRN
jgi:phospholipid/cholesterol/gamma-HCH transport system ATP-binding protein